MKKKGALLYTPAPIRRLYARESRRDSFGVITTGSRVNLHSDAEVGRELNFNYTLNSRRAAPMFVIPARAYILAKVGEGGQMFRGLICN